jgi:hypothetical protein
LDDQHDDRGQENQVNEVPDRVDIDESQQRENQQHNKDGPEHIFLWVGLLFFVCRGVAALKDFSKFRGRFRPATVRQAAANKLLAALIRKD